MEGDATELMVCGDVKGNLFLFDYEGKREDGKETEAY
jgi:hypothetical protein